MTQVNTVKGDIKKRDGNGQQPLLIRSHINFEDFTLPFNGYCQSILDIVFMSKMNVKPLNLVILYTHLSSFIIYNQLHNNMIKKERRILILEYIYS